ncbi:MAG: T9SS type A sorting domain-containing protein, partial [Flavobacteriaceae bacterium]|nr:T9SS type A sorting domain-containing protein [Flavobacteriaceae bacterium]
NAFGWESQGLNYGTFNIGVPNPYTTIAPGSGTAEFESAGAIDPADNNNGVVVDNVGDLWLLDVPSGTYTFVGNMGVVDATGLEFDLSSGILYMTTLTDLYIIDPLTPSATFVGSLGTSGQAAIALAIDNTSTGYTYDITDDTFYTVDLATGAATAVGTIGFDASFGQGMFYDDATDQVYLASLNAGAGNLGELRSADVTTGATTLIGEWNPGVVSQVAWASVGNALNLGVEENLLAEVSVYPNPASDVINVRVPNGVEIQNVTVYDLLGKDTGLRIVNGQIDINELSRGVYMVNIQTTAGTLTEKVVKK